MSTHSPARYAPADLQAAGQRPAALPYTFMLHKSCVVIYCIHMNTDTFSVRVDRSTGSRLEKLAKSTGRSRSFLAAEAIAAYLDTNEWQISDCSIVQLG